jgi:mono/diheme cytochrome c family protein
MDIGSLLLPLGTTNGTTNAVIFGVALMRHRDPDLSIVQRSPRFDLMHHDMDAPAWWHYRRRKTLYADGFAPKGHRILMQFLLVKENGPEKFREWEDDFRAIEEWIASLEPPRWTGPLDRGLADKGAGVFADHCASCHGTYGVGASYPDRVVPIEEVGTDRVRLDSLTAKERSELTASWFGHFGEDGQEIRDRAASFGYVAPPLDGVWATAPYFHNGSVPTLWHVLHPAERPTVWRRTPTGYDDTRVGEVFINRIMSKTSAKVGTLLDGVCRDSAILMSIALQHGTNLATLRHAITRDSDGDPSTIVGAIVDRLAKDVA